MFKKGDEAAAPIMISRVCGKRAGDVLAPPGVIGKMTVSALLTEETSPVALERDDGDTVGDFPGPF
jgi:hypothetical protein